MRRAKRAVAAWICATVVAHNAQAAESGQIPVHDLQASLQAAFSPWDNVEDLICDTVAAANSQILVQAYLLTSKKLAAALITAHHRGVDVKILVDAEQLQKVATSTAPELAAAGIAVWREVKYQNAHNKVIIIDAGRPGAAVITGSYDFTWTAQHRNAENILIVRNHPALVGQYTRNWELHRNEAIPLGK